MRAPSYMVGRQMANALLTLLSGYTGIMGGAGGVSVKSVFIENETEDWIEASRDYWVRQDAMIGHYE
jgi:hypothetical protein